MTDRQALSLCKRILKLQKKLFKGESGENYMDIYARNGENGMSCVGITIKSGDEFKKIAMIGGKLIFNCI